MNKDTIHTIGDKTMDRKGFLKYSGFIVFSLLGLRTLVDILSKSDIQKVSSANNSESFRDFVGGRCGV